MSWQAKCVHIELLLYIVEEHRGVEQVPDYVTKTDVIAPFYCKRCEYTASLGGAQIGRAMVNKLKAR